MPNPAHGAAEAPPDPRRWWTLAVLCLSLIVISLDFYIGPKASYVPDVPQYVLRRYRKEFIVPSVVLLLSQRYNRTSPTDQSLLTEMVYYGKAFEFAKDVQPDLPDNLATVIFPSSNWPQPRRTARWCGRTS